jgi:hypothetical protein
LSSVQYNGSAMAGCPETLNGAVYGTNRTMRSTSAPLSSPIGGAGSAMVGVINRSLPSSFHQLHNRRA